MRVIRLAEEVKTEQRVQSHNKPLFHIEHRKLDKDFETNLYQLLHWVLYVGDIHPDCLTALFLQLYHEVVLYLFKRCERCECQWPTERKWHQANVGAGTCFMHSTIIQLLMIKMIAFTIKRWPCSVHFVSIFQYIGRGMCFPLPFLDLSSYILTAEWNQTDCLVAPLLSTLLTLCHALIISTH